MPVCPTTAPRTPSTPRKTKVLPKVLGFSIYSVCVLEANEKQVFTMYNDFFHYVKQVCLTDFRTESTVGKIVVGEYFHMNEESKAFA